VKACEIQSALLLGVSLVIIGAEQHRISILHHEAIHRLLFHNVQFNDRIGLFLLGGTLGILPYSSREAHFSHHKSLGTELDRERIPYLSVPTSEVELLKWCVLKLTAVEGILRVASLVKASLANTLNFESETPDSRSLVHNVSFVEWTILMATQIVLLAVFYFTFGYQYYFILWLLPLFTVTRLLVAVRSISEHWAKDECCDPEVKFLNSMYCNRVERFLFGPYYFNYHAEHHLFPSIPSWKLPGLSQKLRNHPEFQKSVLEHGSYLFFFAVYFNSWRSKAVKS
jgi:fatty acid desaturase